MASQETSPFDLRDQLAVLRRRKLVVVGTAVIAVALALGLALIQERVYQSTAEVLITRERANQILDDTPTPQVLDAERTIRSDLALLKSEQIRAEVRERLGRAPTIATSSEAESDLIRVTARSPEPRTAAEVANAYAEAFVEYRRREAANAFEQAATKLQPKVDDLQEQIDALGAQIAVLPAAERVGGGNTLQSRRDALVTQQVQVQQKINDLQVAASLENGGARVVTPAKVPTSPASPKPVRNAILAAVLGLVAGVAFAFVLDYLNDALVTRRDVDRVTPGVVALGEIPVFRSKGDEEHGDVVSQSDPYSVAAEAYRQLRTSLQAIMLEQPVGLLQVTSPSSAEGKTTTLANLAVSLCQAGQRIAMVDCDLRRPRLHNIFGMTNDVGFTSVIAGRFPLSGALRSVPGIERLSLLASGDLPTNPSEILATARAAEVLRALLGHADMVLIDTPPILPVTDAAVLAKWVDAVMLIAASGRTGSRQFVRAVELLEQAKAPVMGMVLNQVSAGSGGYGYGAYGYSTYRPNGQQHRDVGDVRRSPAGSKTDRRP